MSELKIMNAVGVDFDPDFGEHLISISVVMTTNKYDQGERIIGFRFCK